MNDSTNQDNQRLRQMLEEVTAADASTAAHAKPEEGGVEIASLRETWLAFGQLIRAADASLPAMPKIAASIVPQKSRRSRWSHSRWVGLTAATAAALLVAVTFACWIRRDSDRGAGCQPAGNMASADWQLTPRASSAALVRQEQSKTAEAEKAANQQPKAGTIATSNTNTATSTWDDPLETQIASVSQQISNVEQNWQHRVDDVDLVQYRIDAVTDSLQNDKL